MFRWYPGDELVELHVARPRVGLVVWVSEDTRRMLICIAGNLVEEHTGGWRCVVAANLHTRTKAAALLVAADVDAAFSR